jgi:hypothetical protein
LEGRGRWIAWAQEFGTSLNNIVKACLLKTTTKRTGDINQAVKHLHSRYKPWSSNPSTTTKKKKKGLFLKGKTMHSLLST